MSTAACQKPGWVGFASVISLLGGYQYGNKRLRSMQAKHLKAQEEENERREQQHRDEIEDLKSKLAAAEEKINGKPAAAPVVSEASTSSDSPAGEAGWLSEWIEAGDEIKK